MSLFTYLLLPRRHVVSHECDIDQRGQATTEYALILLVAAVIATLVIAWATFGGGSGRIGELFDTIFDGILQRAEPTAP
jgi:Flp pilus assembly pilin Flp